MRSTKRSLRRSSDFSISAEGVMYPSSSPGTYSPHFESCRALLVKGEAKSYVVRCSVGGAAGPGCGSGGRTGNPGKLCCSWNPRQPSLNVVRIRRPAGSPQKQNSQIGLPGCRCEGEKAGVPATSNGVMAGVRCPVAGRHSS